MFSRFFFKIDPSNSPQEGRAINCGSICQLTTPSLSGGSLSPALSKGRGSTKLLILIIEFLQQETQAGNSPLLPERSGEAKKRRHITVPPKYFAMGTLAHKRIFY